MKITTKLFAINIFIAYSQKLTKLSAKCTIRYYNLAKCSAKNVQQVFIIISILLLLSMIIFIAIILLHFTAISYCELLFLVCIHVISFNQNVKQFFAVFSYKLLEFMNF